MLRSDQVMLVGWIIDAAYDTDAHNKTPRNGSAINTRRAAACDRVEAGVDGPR